ncbi:MAG: hypothetical protein FWE35_10895 [Streptosporangiales bacterium]|nr:hypothetical protein [Streptosporangiales bacterium]
MITLTATDITLLQAGLKDGYQLRTALALGRLLLCTGDEFAVDNERDSANAYQKLWETIESDDRDGDRRLDNRLGLLAAEALHDAATYVGGMMLILGVCRDHIQSSLDYQRLEHRIRAQLSTQKVIT